MAGQGNYRFISTKRGGEGLVYDDYMFRVNRRSVSKKYWKCIHHDCHVSAVTEGTNVVKHPDTKAHCHINDDLEIKRKEFKSQITQEVVNYCFFLTLITAQ
jgi:hypothetical protein